MSLNLDEVYSLEIRMLRDAFHTNLKRAAVFSLIWLFCVSDFVSVIVAYPFHRAVMTGFWAGGVSFLYLWFRYWRLYSRQRTELALAKVGKEHPNVKQEG